MTLKDSLLLAIKDWRLPGLMDRKRAFLEQHAGAYPSVDE